MNNSLNLIKTIKSLFVNDNSDPVDGHCIHYYVEDRIIMSFVPKSNVIFPQITLNVSIDENISNLPSEYADLNIKVWYNNIPGAGILCRQCCDRVVELLDNKMNDLYDINNDCILRLIDKRSIIILSDEQKQQIYGSISFEIIFKKE